MTKSEKQLFNVAVQNSNAVDIFCAYYETYQDFEVIKLLKTEQTQSQIAKYLGVAQPTLSRRINKIANHYIKFCKCIGEITADKLNNQP